MTGSVTVRVPAKVNVQLAVGGPRSDGYHDLANVFLAVGLHDEVTVRPADELRVTCAGPDAAQVPLDHSNLAARAALALAARYGRDANVHIHIDKDIPVAGGMAGGSADGAGALLACDALWGGPAPRAKSCWASAPSWAATCRSASSAVPRWGAGAASC
ncbi:hypothetical protein GCM10020000_48050 [Streptomyces olivoverticillatus]